MATYFALELDTTPPAIEVGGFSYHRATGTLEVPISVDDPEAAITASFIPTLGEPVELVRRGDIYSYTFGEEHGWYGGTLVVIAIDPVWNAASYSEDFAVTQVPTNQTYKTFERYPINLYEHLRYNLGLSEDEVVRMMNEAEEQLRSDTSAQERYPADPDARPGSI